MTLCSPPTKYEEIVLDHLNQVLTSATFGACPQLSRLLNYLVRSALANPVSDVKEQVIGVEVFERSPDWDPQNDSIVRVEVRRLRKKLVEYYSEEGRTESVRINIPKGGYAADISAAPNPPSDPPAEGVEPQMSVESHSDQTRPDSRSLTRRSLLVGAGSAVAFAIAWGSRKSSAAVPRPPVANLLRLTYERGDLTNAAFTPDGESVVYSARWGDEPITIFSKQVGQSHSRSLGLPEADLLDLAPSGDMLLNLGGGQCGTLARASLSGGPCREIVDGVADATWLPDGRAIAAARIEKSRFGIEFPLGRPIHELKARPTRVSLAASKDGQHLAFVDTSFGSADFCVAESTGKVQRVSSGWRVAGGVRWTPATRQLLLSGARRGSPALHLLDLDSPTDELSVYSTPNIWNLYDCLPSGRLLAAYVDSTLHVVTGTAASGDGAGFTAVAGCRLVGRTPDGQMAVLMDLLGADENGNSPILMASSPSKVPVRVGEGIGPQLSPDGRLVAFVERTGKSDTIVTCPIPTGLPNRYALPAGTRCDAVEFAGRADVFLVQIRTRARERQSHLFFPEKAKLLPVPGTSTVTIVALDGKRAISLAGTEVRVAHLETGEARTLCRLRPGWAPIRWAATGDGIFVFEPGERYGSGEILRIDAGSGDRRVATRLCPADRVGVYLQPWVDITPDGTKYAYTFQRDLSTLYAIDGLFEGEPQAKPRA